MTTAQRLILAVSITAVLSALVTACGDDIEKRQKDYCPYKDPEQCELFRK